MTNAPSRIEYACTVCGRTTASDISTGKRPDPGHCPRSSDGKKPHKWVVNRKF